MRYSFDLGTTFLSDIHLHNHIVDAVNNGVASQLEKEGLVFLVEEQDDCGAANHGCAKHPKHAEDAAAATAEEGCRSEAK